MEREYTRYTLSVHVFHSTTMSVSFSFEVLKSHKREVSFQTSGRQEFKKSTQNIRNPPEYLLNKKTKKKRI